MKQTPKDVIQAQAQLRGLLGALGEQPEGFEDDSLTYLHIGFAGGLVAPEAEEQLWARLARAFKEGARQLTQEHLLTAARAKAVRNQEAVRAWLQRKQLEGHQREGEPREEQRPSRDDSQQHYAEWCRKYDEERSRRRRGATASSQQLQAAGAFGIDLRRCSFAAAQQRPASGKVCQSHRNQFIASAASTC